MGSSVQSNHQAADSSAEPDGQANLPYADYSNRSNASTVVSTPPLQQQQQPLPQIPQQQPQSWHVNQRQYQPILQMQQQPIQHLQQQQYVPYAGAMRPSFGG